MYTGGYGSCVGDSNNIEIGALRDRAEQASTVMGEARRRAVRFCHEAGAVDNTKESCVLKVHKVRGLMPFALTPRPWCACVFERG